MSSHILVSCGHITEETLTTSEGIIHKVFDENACPFRYFLEHVSDGVTDTCLCEAGSFPEAVMEAKKLSDELQVPYVFEGGG